jgi:hypothetical protein
MSVWRGTGEFGGTPRACSLWAEKAASELARSGAILGGGITQTSVTSRPDLSGWVVAVDDGSEEPV